MDTTDRPEPRAVTGAAAIAPARRGPAAVAGAVGRFRLGAVTVPLRLPTLQNWTCRSCAGCCREHLIELSPEEVARLDDQGWTGAAGGKPTPGGVPPVVPLDPASNLLAGGGFVPGKWLPDAVKNRAAGG